MAYLLPSRRAAVTGIGLVASVLFILAGCGTTVPLTQSSSSGFAGKAGSAAVRPSGSGSTGQGGPGGVGSFSGGRSSAASGLQAGNPPPTSGTHLETGQSGTTSAAPSASSPPTARRATAGPAQVGIEYFDSSQAVSTGEAVGYSVSPGDPYGEARTLVSWINQHGGLEGHQVDPIYWQLPIGSTEDSAEQSACQAWTADHHVVAVIWPNNFSSTGILPACLAKAGVMLTGGADTYLNTSQLRTAGGYVQTPYMFAGDRMYQYLVDRLVATHWFAPGARIGVLSDDGPTYQANVQTVDQALARHGLSAIDHETLSSTSPEQDSTDCQSAGLRFLTDHVTNIVVVDDGARAFLYCSPVFRTQSYFPKFSVTSYDSPSTVETLVPASSLKGSAGIGWEPVNDVTPFTPNSAGSQCISIMQAAGENVTASALTEAIAFAYCDGFFFLHRAYAAAATLAPVGVQQSIAGMGTGFVSPIAFETRFGPGRFDGAGAAADLAYQGSCSCYRYASAPAATD